MTPITVRGARLGRARRARAVGPRDPRAGCRCAPVAASGRRHVLAASGSRKTSTGVGPASPSHQRGSALDARRARGRRASSTNPTKSASAATAARTPASVRIPHAFTDGARRVWKRGRRRPSRCRPDELRRGGRRIGAPQQAGPDQDGGRAGLGRSRQVRAAGDPALGNHRRTRVARAPQQRRATPRGRRPGSRGRGR